MENNLEVKIVDSVRDCLKDNNCCAKSTKKKSEDERKPSGYVEVYEVSEDGKKQLVGKHNLVVYLGREWLATRIFATNNVEIEPTYEEWICWLGVGHGGCTESDPLIPIPPTNSDTDLNEPNIISSDPEAEYSDWYDSTSEVGWRKKNLGSITFEEDPNNDNSYLIIRVETLLNVGEADGTIINEVGLFTAASAVPHYLGPFHLYARVTFSSIPKTPERRLLFSWYIYV